MSQPGPSATSPAAAPSPASGPSKPEIPWAFIDCSADTLIILISHMLNLLIEHNDQVVLTPDALTRFHSRAAPAISVIEYLRRIVKYTNMEKIPLLSLLAYIDLTCAHLPTFTLSTLTVHRFLIAGVCAGSKAQCDVFCTNSHYAKVGGIKVGELNALEREFLRVTQWNLCCNADLLQRYYTSLIRSHGGFTQAAAPESPPFRAFPRSISKPRTPDEDAEERMEGEQDGDAPAAEGEDADMADEAGYGDDETLAGSAGPSRAEEDRIRRRRKSVDEVLGVPVQAEGGQVYARGRRRREGQSMEIESTPEDMGKSSSPSPDSPKPGLSLLGPDVSPAAVNPHFSPESPISPASSSIPSSSRSSIRTTSRTAGRPPNMTNLSGGGRIAEAVLDRRHAGMRGTSTPDVLGGTVRPPAPDTEQNLLASTEEEEGSGRSRVPGDEAGAEPTTNGHASSSSHHPAPGKILKNLVGVFRKRSSQPPPADPSESTSQPGHRPQTIIPSRPLSTSDSQMRPPSPSIRGSPRPRHTDSRPAPGSPRDADMRSPGLAIDVTPRIRTRDERSVESLRDRNGYGVGVGSV